MAKTALLTWILAVAVYFDLRYRRIPNALIVVGLAVAAIVALQGPALAGVMAATGGLLIGGAVFLPFFALRMLGAGDVKLMSLVGAFVGSGDIWLVLLYTFLAGGVLGSLSIVASGRTLSFFSGFRRWIMSLPLLKDADSEPLMEIAGRSVLRIPYAVAIAAGCLVWMFQRA